MPYPAAMAVDFYRRQALTSQAAARRVQERFRGVDVGNLREWVEAHSDELIVPILDGQAEAAGRAAAYVAAQSGVQNVATPEFDVNPLMFTTDPDALASMTYSAAVIAPKQAAAAGLSPVLAGRVAARRLVRLASTAVADAGREATQASLVTSGHQGYVRMLQLPSCRDCAVQAGKFFKWNAGFQRHPNCDCVHIPSSEASGIVGAELNVTEAIRSGQVSGLSKAETTAIVEDGANPGQVINARRGGLQTSTMFGQKVQHTLEGTTRRGLHGGYRRDVDGGLSRRADSEWVKARGYRRVRRPRLTPAEVYRQAGDDRAEAIRLLLDNGYITDGVTDPAARAAIAAAARP